MNINFGLEYIKSRHSGLHRSYNHPETGKWESSKRSIILIEKLLLRRKAKE